MPAEQNFAMFAAQYDEAIRAGADAAMRAGLAKTAVLLPYALVPMVVVCGVLLAVGQLGWGKFLSYATRVCVLLWLVVGMAYTTHVADLMVDGLPNEIASAVNGGGRDITSAEQFDILDDSTTYFTAQIKAQATGPFNAPARMAADAANAYAKFWLGLFFYLWIVVRIATRLLVAATAFLLFFLLFDSTRGWLMQMGGKLVGVTVWQLMTAILTAVMIAGSRVYLRDAIENPGGSLDDQLDRLWDIGGWFLGCFIVLLIVPTLSGFGAAAAPQRLMLRAAGNATRFAWKTAGGAANQAARALRYLVRARNRR